MVLFAQRGGNMSPEEANLLAGTFLVIVLATLAVVILIGVFYCLSMSKALKQCHPRNRTMEPAMVWLLFVPLFNTVWQFFVVNRVADSLRREYRARGIRASGDFGAGVGITACVLGLLGWIPLLGPFLSLGGLVCRIIQWVKVAGHGGELAQEGRPTTPRSRDDYEEDEEDDRPRRSRREEDDFEDDRDEERPRRRR